MTGNISKSKGFKGDRGDTGPRGPQGEKGDAANLYLRYNQETGDLYYTTEYVPSINTAPYIGDNGNWYVFDGISQTFVDSGVASSGNVSERYISEYIDKQTAIIKSDIEGLQKKINEEAHFRGYLSTNAKVQALEATPNDFAYSAESNTKWVYDAVNGWQDTGTPVPDQLTPASDTTPLINGEASSGTENAYARGDHRHPTDTTRASVVELNTKADKSTTLAGYGIEDAYTKENVDSMIKNNIKIISVDYPLDLTIFDNYLEAGFYIFIAANDIISEVYTLQVETYVNGNEAYQILTEANGTMRTRYIELYEPYPIWGSWYSYSGIISLNNLLKKKADSTALDTKADKPIIETINPGVFYAFNFLNNYNKEIRLLSTGLIEIEFYIANGEYQEDYTAGLSFDSNDTPTEIIYTSNNIINWVGVDCSTVDGLSILQPSANTHYDIVFYYNGNQFIGLVNGYVPASGNVVSE